MLITFMIAFWLSVPQETVPVPTDITVWNGLSLALAFNIIVTVLRALKIIPDGPIKKSIGYILMGIGAIIGGVYAVGQGQVEFIQLVTYVAGGALSGVTAIGLHSTYKNGREAVKMLQNKP